MVSQDHAPEIGSVTSGQSPPPRATGDGLTERVKAHLTELRGLSAAGFAVVTDQCLHDFGEASAALWRAEREKSVWKEIAQEQSRLRKAAEAQVEALRKALELIRTAASEWDGPIMRAWGASRAALLDGEMGSGPRDRLESAISACFHDAADDALAALTDPK